MSYKTLAKEKKIKTQKNKVPQRVAVPTNLHTWAKGRAVVEKVFLQDIVANSIKYYRKMVEKEEG